MWRGCCCVGRKGWLRWGKQVNLKANPPANGQGREADNIVANVKGQPRKQVGKQGDSGSHPPPDAAANRQSERPTCRRNLTSRSNRSLVPPRNELGIGRLPNPLGLDVRIVQPQHPPRPGKQSRPRCRRILPQNSNCSCVGEYSMAYSSSAGIGVPLLSTAMPAV
ncbi:MAG: hypothetical protein UZ07_CHB004000109 [Chlorobi bacterium OLB7]|nr:MAG: hypothetical protein UZ07_CHB004000109 [Chlorobi bacterium OLB7]